MEMLYSRELGLKALQNATPHMNAEYPLSDALELYHRLKAGGKSKQFIKVLNRSIRYLKECLGHEDLTEIKISDASRLRDHLFAKGMSSSSEKWVFSSVRPIVNFAIREQELAINCPTVSNGNMASGLRQKVLGFQY